MDTCINLADVEALARAKLAGSTTWDYYAGGAEDEYTVGDNCAAFRRIKLRPRVLMDVATRDLSTEALGQRIALPILLKGIMTGEDAALAVEHGVDGIVVSNHGGRQIDGTLTRIDMLPEVIT